MNWVACSSFKTTYIESEIVKLMPNSADMADFKDNIVKPVASCVHSYLLQPCLSDENVIKITTGINSKMVTHGMPKPAPTPKPGSKPQSTASKSRLSSGSSTSGSSASGSGTTAQASAGKGKPRSNNGKSSGGSKNTAVDTAPRMAKKGERDKLMRQQKVAANNAAQKELEELKLQQNLLGFPPIAPLLPPSTSQGRKGKGKASGDNEGGGESGGGGGIPGGLSLGGMQIFRPADAAFAQAYGYGYGMEQSAKQVAAANALVLEVAREGKEDMKDMAKTGMSNMLKMAQMNHGGGGGGGGDDGGDSRALLSPGNQAMLEDRKGAKGKFETLKRAYEAIEEDTAEDTPEKEFKNKMLRKKLKAMGDLNDQYHLGEDLPDLPP